MTTTNRPDLDAIAAREEAATPGPWGPAPDMGPHWIGAEVSGYWRIVGELVTGTGPDADADRAFVVHARTDVPALLSEVRRLTAELETARRQERERCAAAVKQVAESQETPAMRFVAGLGADRIRALPDEDTPAAEETPEDEGRTWKTVRVQRACNGCGNDLRDVNEAELNAAVAGRQLPDVTGECPTCTPSAARTTEETP